MGAAIAYAQSGHLVLATMHANSSSHALNRIVSFYSPENRRVLLSDLSSTLRAVVSQRLLRSLDGGRVPAVEVLLNNNHMSELIEQGRISEIKEAMSNSMTAGSRTFEDALIELILSGKVSRDDALANSDSPTNLLWLLENRAQPGVQPGAQPAAAATTGLGLPDVLQAHADESARQAAAQTAPEKSPAKPDGASFSEFLLNI
jgi:twitching motility protein PilU